MNTLPFYRSVLALSVLMAASAVPAVAQDRSAAQTLPTEPRALEELPSAPEPSPDEATAAITTLSGTPILEVENAGAVWRLRLNDDGGFVLGGGSGAIPATGAGTRLMWYPAKAAFRAGSVSGAQWDVTNVGDFSIATGQQTIARGLHSIAMGYATVATGPSSTAMGHQASADGGGATAMGVATIASGFSSTAIGNSTRASGGYSTAMGRDSQAQGSYSMAMGRNTEAGGDYSTATGQGTEAWGSHSTAMGEGSATAAGARASTAMGYNALTVGFGSMAMGTNAEARGDYSTAMGHGTIANGDISTALGSSTRARGYASTAMGENTQADSRGAVVLGRWNLIDGGNATTWVGTDPLLIAGNGTGNGNRSNALTLLKNGNLTIAGTLTQSSDARLKEDVTAYEGGLGTVLALAPVRYRFREGTNRPGGHQIGLVAQDVQAVLPELVHEDADGYLSVSYAGLTPVLAAAVQEQQAQIEALRAENEALRLEAAENAELRQRLAALEAAVARLAALDVAVARLAGGDGVAETR